MLHIQRFIYQLMRTENLGNKINIYVTSKCFFATKNSQLFYLDDIDVFDKGINNYLLLNKYLIWHDLDDYFKREVDEYDEIYFFPTLMKIINNNENANYSVEKIKSLVNELLKENIFYYREFLYDDKTNKKFNSAWKILEEYMQNNNIEPKNRDWYPWHTLNEKIQKIMDDSSKKQYEKYARNTIHKRGKLIQLSDKLDELRPEYCKTICAGEQLKELDNLGMEAVKLYNETQEDIYQTFLHSFGDYDVKYEGIFKNAGYNYGELLDEFKKNG